MPKSNPRIQKNTENAFSDLVKNLISRFWNQDTSRRSSPKGQEWGDRFSKAFNLLTPDEQRSFFCIYTNNNMNENYHGTVDDNINNNPDLRDIFFDLVTISELHGTIRFPLMHSYIERNHIEDTIDINKYDCHINWGKFWKEFRALNSLSSPDNPKFDEFYEVVQEIQGFREGAIQKLQVALNGYLSEVAQTQRPEGAKARTTDLLPYDQKQAIVAFVNAPLEKLGLAIQYKGQPCYLTCLKGTSEGRFALVPKGYGTAVLARSNLSDFLPLELMDAAANVEMALYARRAHKNQKPGKGSERG